MRKISVAAMLLLAAMAMADDGPKPISITVEPLGDRGDTIVAQLIFRLANPHAVTEAGLWVDGTVTQQGAVARNFRIRVPRKGDRMVWEKSTVHNGKTVRVDHWSVMPDKRNEMAFQHAFNEGEAEVDAWLILEGDYGDPPRTIAHATERVTVAKTNRQLPAPVVEFEEPPVPAAPPWRDETSAVHIAAPRPIEGSALMTVSVDVQPPVQRVEFRVNGKRVLVRNAPPYVADLDLDDDARLEAIGFDARGRYIDAGAFVKPASCIGVKLTRVVADGFVHFKISVTSPVKSMFLYAGETKLEQWDGPPFAFSMSAADAVDGPIRVVAVDESGCQATDVIE